MTMVSDRYRKGLAEMRRHLGAEEADEYLAKIDAISSEFAKVNAEGYGFASWLS